METSKETDVKGLQWCRRVTQIAELYARTLHQLGQKVVFYFELPKIHLIQIYKT